MMLTEQTVIPSGALPLQAFKDHLRLGTGFSDDGMQDTLLETYLRAALATIEARIGKTLITRRFLLQLPFWRSMDEQALPVAPISLVHSVTVIDRAGVVSVLDPARYRLQLDMHRPKLLASGAAFPQADEGGRIEIVFDAGFGTGWTNVPQDLAQAVMLLAAELHENRHENGSRPAGLPVLVQSMIERWRTVRILGGGRA